MKFFSFAVDVSLKSLVRTPVVRKSTMIFIWKTNNENQLHGKKITSGVIINEHNSNT